MAMMTISTIHAHLERLNIIRLLKVYLCAIDTKNLLFLSFSIFPLNLSNLPSCIMRRCAMLCYVCDCQLWWQMGSTLVWPDWLIATGCSIMQQKNALKKNNAILTTNDNNSSWISWTFFVRIFIFSECAAVHLALLMQQQQKK